MAPPPAATSSLPLFSPSQLAYLHTSLSLRPPIRPDARTPTAFRSLHAETDFLPAANGSARVCFAEGGEAVVGIGAEVEQTAVVLGGSARRAGEGRRKEEEEEKEGQEGDDGWVEVGIEQREDEAEGVFLAEILREALLADGNLRRRLVISRKWHWRLFVDIVLLSPPSSYPLPLLSLTTHLALLSCRLPALKSSLDDDPMFNDDWDAAIPLYPFVDDITTPPVVTSKPQNQNQNPKILKKRKFKPPVTLLVISVGENIFFDPSSEELAVADAVLAISIGQVFFSDLSPISAKDRGSLGGGEGEGEGEREELRLLTIRTIDPPSRQFASTPITTTTAATADATTAVAVTEAGARGVEGGKGEEGVWKKRMGGMKRGLVSKIIKMILEGGVGVDVFRGLETWA